jgi:hypothetical protein
MQSLVTRLVKLEASASGHAARRPWAYWLSGGDLTDDAPACIRSNGHDYQQDADRVIWFFPSPGTPLKLVAAYQFDRDAA